MKAISVIFIVGLAAVTSMAAPDLLARQNDIKKCKDGIQGPSGGYDKREHIDLHTQELACLANRLTSRGRLQEGLLPQRKRRRRRQRQRLPWPLHECRPSCAHLYLPR